MPFVTLSALRDELRQDPCLRVYEWIIIAVIIIFLAFFMFATGLAIFPGRFPLRLALETGMGSTP